MKHEETTLNTKRKLAASLKYFMGKKPLSKITVSEIIADCGINRKTFYYHFEDIYALMKWMLEEEAVEADFKFFLAHFYTGAIAGLMVDEITKKGRHEPEKAVEYLTLVLDSLPEVLAKKSVQ